MDNILTEYYNKNIKTEYTNDNHMKVCVYCMKLLVLHICKGSDEMYKENDIPVYLEEANGDYANEIQETRRNDIYNYLRYELLSDLELFDCECEKCGKIVYPKKYAYIYRRWRRQGPGRQRKGLNRYIELLKCPCCSGRIELRFMFIDKNNCHVVIDTYMKNKENLDILVDMISKGTYRRHWDSRKLES